MGQMVKAMTKSESRADAILCALTLRRTHLVGWAESGFLLYTVVLPLVAARVAAPVKLGIGCAW